MNKETETHPWPPFIPEGAKVLVMGTFPPPRLRWSMDFYYPNRTNDFWKIMGMIFLGNSHALLTADGKNFELDAIKALLTEKKIALNDTGRTVHRLKGNASDKFLEILEPVPLFDLLAAMPDCRAIATTGEKAAGVVASLTATAMPRMGTKVRYNDRLDIWRMPSTSRAYPLRLEAKAAYYEKMFLDLGIL